MDIVNSETRSRMMAGIRGRDTRPEIAVRRYLHATGMRFRLGGGGLPGRPDIVLPGRRVVVFVHGCFWHRHGGCRLNATPSTRQDFWQRKFEANMARDANANAAIIEMGWTPLTIWECETRSTDSLDRLFWQIASCR